MPQRYARADATRVEAIGTVWASFSALTGETALLNDESAAILEVLWLGTASTEQVCAALAKDMGTASATLTEVVERSWPQLIEAGLVQRVHNDPAGAG